MANHLSLVPEAHDEHDPTAPTATPTTTVSAALQAEYNYWTAYHFHRREPGRYPKPIDTRVSRDDMTLDEYALAAEFEMAVAYRLPIRSEGLSEFVATLRRLFEGTDLMPVEVLWQHRQKPVHARILAHDGTDLAGDRVVDDQEQDWFLAPLPAAVAERTDVPLESNDVWHDQFAAAHSYVLGYCKHRLDPAQNAKPEVPELLVSRDALPGARAWQLADMEAFEAAHAPFQHIVDDIVAHGERVEGLVAHLPAHEQAKARDTAFTDEAGNVRLAYGHIRPVGQSDDERSSVQLVRDERERVRDTLSAEGSSSIARLNAFVASLASRRSRERHLRAVSDTPGRSQSDE